MKCKYIEKKRKYLYNEGGLIEAYWNVNVNNCSPLPALVAGLIEAYWNVNLASDDVKEFVVLGLIEAYWNVNEESLGLFVEKVKQV